MNVLLLGSGAREHALAWKLSSSPALGALTCAPGNDGIAAEYACRAVDAASPEAVVALAQALRADLVVVGPEAPLVAGVADALAAAGVPVFGPMQAAARIEGSKAFAKDLMAEARVPTARSEVFDDVDRAEARARAWGAVVVKADGLAAGKGVVVARDGAEAAAAVRALGATPAGRRLVLEERLEGPELSVMALCDGARFTLLPPAQDHKRLLDGDLGPNTGGMGAYAPAPLLDAGGLDRVGEQVIAPVLAALARRGAPFRGALYAGLMLTREGPRVLEFNCRLGDPETQPLMAQVEGDLLPTLKACADGDLGGRQVRARSGASVGVVLAAHGYPEAPRAGDRIEGLDQAPLPGAQRFCAGLRRHDGSWVTSGGRVLTVCAHADTLEAARALAYAEAARIRFPGRQLRADIGARSTA